MAAKKRQQLPELGSSRYWSVVAAPTVYIDSVRSAPQKLRRITFICQLDTAIIYHPRNRE